MNSILTMILLSKYQIFISKNNPIVTMSDITSFAAVDDTAPKQTVDYVEKEIKSENLEIKATTINVCYENVVDDKRYIVEKILDKLIINGKVWFLIKWKEYSDDEKSWEPEESLFCDELLKASEIKITSQNTRMENGMSIINGISSINATVPSTCETIIYYRFNNYKCHFKFYTLRVI